MKITNKRLLEIESDLINSIYISNKDVYKDSRLDTKLLSIGNVFKLNKCLISNLGDHQIIGSQIVIDLHIQKIGYSETFYIKHITYCHHIEDLKYTLATLFRKVNT